MPLDKDPRADRFLLDQLVDTGTKTVEGMAAVNGDKLKAMGAVTGTKMVKFSGFAEAHTKLQAVMETLRKGGDVPCHFEKTDGKLKDEFSVFKGRLTPEKGLKVKEDKPDFNADFDVTEGEEEEKGEEEVKKRLWLQAKDGQILSMDRYMAAVCALYQNTWGLLKRVFINGVIAKLLDFGFPTNFSARFSNMILGHPELLQSQHVAFFQQWLLLVHEISSP